MRRVGDEMKKKTKFVIFSVFAAAVLLVILLGIVCFRMCGYELRGTNIEYIVNIYPKEGEELKNVTVYLPFPMYKGKAAGEVFEGIKNEYVEFRLDKFSGVKFNITETTDGPMLKVEIPELKNGFGATPDIHKTLSIFSSEDPGKEYVLSPVFELTEPQKRVKESGHTNIIRTGKTKLFIDYEGGTGIIFGLRYEVRTRSHLWISLYSASDAMYLVGIDDVPDRDIGFGPYRLEINEKGWMEAPFIEIYD